MIGNNWCDLLTEVSKMRWPYGENALFLPWERKKNFMVNHVHVHFRTISIHNKWIGTTILSPKVNVQIASWVAERLKTEDFRKFGDFKQIPEKLRIDGKSSDHPKAEFRQLCNKIAKNLLWNTKETPISLAFVNLPTIFSPCFGRSLDKLDQRGAEHGDLKFSVVLNFSWLFPLFAPQKNEK